MFTWICQKCGSEVPPSENDCPNCRVKTAQTAPPVADVTRAPVPPVSAPVSHPEQAAERVLYSASNPTPPLRAIPPADAPPSFSAPSPAAGPRRGLSPTLVAMGSAIGILAVLAVLYLYVLPKSSEKTDTVALETPAVEGAGVSAAAAHPLAKYIEITGLRIVEDGRGQVKISYVVVNHSPADLPELQTQMTLGAGGKQIFEFPATIPSIGPYEVKDLSASVRTQLLPYELPDWQKLTPTMKIIAER